MLKGAFFFGGKAKEPYPDVSRVDPDGKIVWGKRIPENFTANIRTQIPQWHKNKLDISQVTHIEDNNFNNFFNFRALGVGPDLVFPNLISIGINCFNNLNSIDRVIISKVTNIKNCFNDGSPWFIQMDQLNRISGESFSNLRTGDNLFLPSLEIIEGSSSFDNFSNVFFINFPKLRMVSNNNFYSMNSGLKQFLVSSSITAESERNLRKSLPSKAVLRKE
nr:hypothetical protein [uncultured Campylobacter sp.]